MKLHDESLGAIFEVADNLKTDLSGFLARKTSPIWNVEELEKAIEAAVSISDVLKNLGLRAAGGNYKTLHEACQAFNLDLPKYDRVISIQKNRLTQKPLSDVLTQDSSYSRGHLKKRLVKENILEYVCVRCGLGSVWQNEPLTLQLEHKNGIWNDNRLENLEFLCPNCHSQTSTFAGRSSKKKKEKKPMVPRSYGTKIVWPKLEDLERMVEENGFSKTGRLLGVSDNAIRKHLKRK